MMRRMAVFSLTLAVALLLPLAASASKSQQFALHFDLGPNGQNSWTGTWSSASGLLNGQHGTVSDTAKATKSKVVHGVETVTGASSADTFRLRFNGKAGANGILSGRFVITHGTGVYKGLHGTGTVSSTTAGNGAVSADYQGKAHFDGHGLSGKSGNQHPSQAAQHRQNGSK